MKDTAIATVEDQYVAFCANPLRDEAQVRAEFRILIEDPDVKHLAFYSEHVLMVGNPPLTITHDRVTYDIGEIIMFLIRRREGRVWHTGFRFMNLTQLERDRLSFGSQHYPHPHVFPAERVQDIPSICTGKICLQKGQFGLYQHLRKGEIHRVVPLLRWILGHYNPKSPARQIANWPVIRGASND